MQDQIVDIHPLTPGSQCRSDRHLNLPFSVFIGHCHRCKNECRLNLADKEIAENTGERFVNVPASLAGTAGVGIN
jgi:hypothetical protein